MTKRDASRADVFAPSLKVMVCSGVVLLFAGWFLGRYQSLKAISSLEAGLKRTEEFQDRFEREIARVARSGDRIADYPYAYEIADDLITVDDEDFTATYRYVLGDEEAIPPQGCEILWYDFGVNGEPMEGNTSDCFLVVVGGIVCKSGQSETLHY